MTKENKIQAKKRYFRVLQFISFLMFTISYPIAQTFKWTDQYQGFLNGCTHFFSLCKMWCFYILPWSVIIYVLYRFKKVKRFKSLCLLLAPPIITCCFHIVCVLTTPLAPGTRFQRFTKTTLPPDIRDLSYNFSGGGFENYTDLYYFRTSPVEVDRIISDLEVYIETRFGKIQNLNQNSAITNFPTLSSWDNATQYIKRNDDGWYYYLATNEARDEVFLRIGCN